jgi:hypothetical protein
VAVRRDQVRLPAARERRWPGWSDVEAEAI